MGNKRIKIILFCFILSNNVIAQNNDYCEIIELALNYKFENKQYKILQTNFSKSKQYEKNLLNKLDSNDVFIMLNKMDEATISFICISNKFKYISEHKFYKIVNRNNKRKYLEYNDNQVTVKKKFAVYSISPLVFYKNYAIIEVCEIYTFMNSVTYGLLLKKIQDKWEIVDIIYSAAS